MPSQRRDGRRSVAWYKARRREECVKRYRAVVAALVAVAAGIVLFTVGRDEREAPPEDSETRDTLVIATLSDPKDALYVVSQQVGDTHLQDPIFLRSVDVDFDCSLTYAPMLAKSWK